MRIWIIGFVFSLVILSLIYSAIKYWHKPNKIWIATLSNLVIWLFPFDYLPSVSVAGARLKLNYIVITITVFVFLNLIIRNQIKAKFDHSFGLLLSLPLFGLLTYTNVINYNKFAINWLGLIFCILSTYFVAFYSTDIKLQIKRLLIILSFCSLFGLYQFVADMIGVSPKFTFLKEMYTKSVFGIPRIQGTANEPQLFAGMLFLPIIYLFLKYYTVLFNNNDVVLKSGPLAQKSIFKELQNYEWLLLITPLVFIATISKGAFLVLGIILIAFILYFAIANKGLIKYKSLLLILPLILAIVGIVVSQPNIYNKIEPVLSNITTTIDGQSATSVERTSFLNEANTLLGDNYLVGIGPGQFGTYVNKESSNMIVNNVYIELWLEYGLVALICFILFLIITLIRLQKVNTEYSWLIFLTLIAYLGQWIFFSPLYILPIFIIIGIALNVTLESESD